MTDYYTQRLDEARQAKRERFTDNSLPLQKPNTQVEVGTGTSNIKTMAGKPTDPSAGPELPGGMFTDMFHQYAKDDQFKAGMAEYAAAIQALKADLNGISLPPQVLERKVSSVLEQFKQKSMASMQQQQTPVVSGGQLIPGGGNGY